MEVTDMSGGKIHNFYILDAEHNVVALPNAAILQWGEFMNTPGNKRVAHNETGDTSVSTVFLGADYSVTCSDAPVVFETMVFGGPMDQYTVRYSTWDEAERGHIETCRKVFV